ncbi:acrosin-like [Python bivittatus]|uniref:Acrosin n=1 Tax=Python bivittatus TaxID=176946 RepID=A0A9F2RC70_PYTBI|nr:acrosin-like [Python bivittatus]
MRWVLLPLQILATVRPARAIVDTCDVCGRHPLVPRHDQSEQVVSSTNAQPGAWPWIVSLQLPTITGHKHTCGGSLVSGRWILTAAHCFANKRDLPHWRAVVGAWRLSSLGSEVHVRYIKRIVIHEDYQRNTETSDIALMELDQPVKCSDYIQPACLPDTTVTVSLLTHCYISGWGILGKAAAREVSDVMHEVKVSRFSVAQCNSSDWYNGAIENHTLCAGYEEGGADICQGDSGGPLMCQEDGSQLFWIIGVTSWGQGCGKAHKPGVYTATQHFYSWIKQLAGPMPQPPPTPMPIPTIKIVLQISHLETQSPKAETPSQKLPEAELEVPPIIETSRIDSTVAKFFRMIQEFLHIVKKEKDAVWVWPKLSELKLIKDTGVASLKESESPPATDLPAEPGGPCQLKGNPSMLLARGCPTRVEKS